MSVHEELSRLLDGELEPEAREALLARIAADPELRASWERLSALPTSFGALLSTPPPAGLDDRVLAAVHPEGSSWLRVVPWALAAAALLAWSWPRVPPELVLADGAVEVSGSLRVLAGDAVIEVDGIAEITVEPVGHVRRVTEAGGEAMSRKRTLLAAATGAAVTVVVYEGSATVRAGTAEPTVIGPGDSVRIGSPPSPRPRVAPADTPESDLQAENQLLRTMVEALEIEYRGTPIPWPADLPEVFRQPAFERNVREAVEDCAPDVQIVGFECTEPPCFALLRPPKREWWDELVNSCPSWTGPYTNSVSSASGSVTCPDGHEERYQVLGWSTHLVAPTGGWPPEERENQSKRFTARIEEIQRSWPCLGESR